jgi:hypothetical protein
MRTLLNQVITCNLAVDGVSTYNTAENYLCNDKICFVLPSVSGSCNLVSTICGNIHVTKKITSVTIRVSVMCKSTRIYYKKYGTVPVCSK